MSNPQAARRGFDGEIGEERLHVDADSFVVAVDACPVRGFASQAGAAHRGEDRGDDLVAQGEQGGDGAGGQRWDSVAAGASGLEPPAIPTCPCGPDREGAPSRLPAIERCRLCSGSEQNGMPPRQNGQQSPN